MNHNLIFLKWLWNRRKTSSFKIPKGGVAIVLTSRDEYDQIVNGLADSDIWGDTNYSRILTNHKTQILTN
jgi:hypothetical protein